MLEIVEYTKKIEDLKKKVQEAGVLLPMEVSKENGIHLVFAGEYSAGKSSILKMITGRQHIEIGEGITTQTVHTYEWNGIEVIDTPGIHSGLRPDHDEIAYQAITSADMLVFVISNELFDGYIADHFRKLAIDKDKAAEMILVVNKMDRAGIGNTVEQQNIMREDLRKVLSPYTPEQVHLCFISAKSYLDSVSVTDSEIREELFARSGYPEFVETLNCFVKEKGMASKLTTELYLVYNELEEAMKKLQPSSADADMDALEENFKQQRRIFTETRGRMRQEVKQIYENAASEIREIGRESANLINEGCKQDEVEEKLEEATRKVDRIIEESQEEATELVQKELNEIGQELESLENNEFSRSLKTRLSGKFDTLPDSIKNILSSTGTGFQKAGKVVTGSAYKAGAAGGMKLTNFSGSKVHDLVLAIGHKFNVKFKPWQATKIAKGIAIGGQVLNVVGAGLSIFMQIKEDQDEEKLREELKKNRQNIRSQFNAAADEFEDFGRKYIQTNINDPLEEPIAALNRNIQEIRDTKTNRSQSCRTLEKLESECRNLIQEIHLSLRLHSH